jgi:exonuclease VII small subunit
MKNRAGLVFLSVCVGLPLAASAQEKGKGKKKNAPKIPTVSSQAFALPMDIELSDEQKTKLAELKKELTPKLEEVQKKVDAVYTDEQKKAREEAFTKARADGKKGKDLKAAYESSVSLTDEQKKQLAAAEKEVAAALKTARDKVLSLLTDEQKSKIRGGKKKDKA